MKKFEKFSFITILVSFLSACGGGEEGKSVKGSGNQQTKTYSHDGFFLNDNIQIWMLVDSERNREGIVTGLFHWDTYYLTDNHFWKGDKLSALGLTYETDWQGSRLFDYGAHYKSEVTFSDDFKQASISGHTRYYAFGDTFTNHTQDLVELSGLLGTHTNPADGTTWDLQKDGYFIINGECTITGTVTKSRFYHEVMNAQATGCVNASENGTDYNGVVIAYSFKGKTYINGVFKNSSAILSVNVPTS